MNLLLVFLLYFHIVRCTKLPIRVTYNKDCTTTKFKTTVQCNLESIGSLEMDIVVKSEGQTNGRSMPVTVDTGSELTWVAGKDTVTWKVDDNGAAVVPNDHPGLYKVVPSFSPISPIAGALISGKLHYWDEQVLKYKLWPQQRITIGDVSTNLMTLAIATEWTALIPPPSPNGVLGLRLSKPIRSSETPISNIICQLNQIGIKRFSILLARNNYVYSGILGINEPEFPKNDRSITLPSSGLLWDLRMTIEARWENTEWVPLARRAKTGIIDSGSAAIYMSPSLFVSVGREKAKVLVEGVVRDLDLKLFQEFLGGERRGYEQCRTLRAVLPWMLRFTATREGKTVSFTIDRSYLMSYSQRDSRRCLGFLNLKEHEPTHEFVLGVPFLLNADAQFDFSTEPQTITLR